MGRSGCEGLSYCAPQCFENAARQCFSDACQLPWPQLLRSSTASRWACSCFRGASLRIRSCKLRSKPSVQSGHRRLGEWLEELGFATEQQVTAGLGLQWACPVLVGRMPRDFASERILPHRLLARLRILPVQFVPATHMFYVAFFDGIDYTALYAIEQMLDCRTQACLIGRSCMDRELERMGHEDRAGDLLFESWHDPAAMAASLAATLLS